MIDRSKNSDWANSIFCQFNDIKLMNEILEFADTIDCEVVEGKRNWSDIVTTPAFILIIDRNVIGQEYWDLYIESLDDTEIEIPCIVIDDNNLFQSPKISSIEYMLPTKENIPKILDSINTAYIIAQEIFENNQWDE